MPSWTHIWGRRSTLLSIQDLSVQYGAFRAVQNVSLVVEDGLIVSVVGANGAGKSTLINTTSGILKPISGSIQFNGLELTNLQAHEIAQHGVVQVPEGRMLFPDLTVLENLMVASLHKRAKAGREQTLREVFELFPKLHERTSQLARTLSGGEQQMLAIGRALMSQPSLLMMDEPSLGLAPLVVKDIFNVVLELKRRGLTVLLVEQNIRHSLQISDYAYVLETGRIVLQGTGREVLADDLTRTAFLGI
jgi:branched-chain amino acid transport system ATP-binding protein